MIRPILGVFLGYISMTIVLFALFSGLYAVLGTAGAFTAGTMVVSSVWFLVGFFIFLIGAVVAGVVCRLVSQNRNAGAWMGATILIIALVGAISQYSMTPASTYRGSDEIPMLEAMANAIQPVWTQLVNAIVGFIGATVGGKLIREQF